MDKKRSESCGMNAHNTGQCDPAGAGCFPIKFSPRKRYGQGNNMACRQVGGWKPHRLSFRGKACELFLKAKGKLRKADSRRKKQSESPSSPIELLATSLFLNQGFSPMSAFGCACAGRGV